MDIDKQVRDMDANNAYRFIIGDLGILNDLTYKHLQRKVPFTREGYTNPCGSDMSKCGRAFSNVVNYFDDIL